MDKDRSVLEVASELQNFELQLSGKSCTYDQLLQELAVRINYLISHDFTLLVSILYRLDISEKKLKVLLAGPGETNAGEVIAEMIIERQLQKIATRKAFKRETPDIPDEEKW